jgi:hypothetical protein
MADNGGMIASALLGFDARVTGADRPAWDGARRARYLLRSDVAAPASTDRLVWPSLFDIDGAPPPPGWIGANASVWDDLEALRDFVARRWPSPVPPYAMVAVTWVSDRGFAEAGATGPYREPTRPPAASSTWALLGFDVADGSLLSGLMNCGYAADEVSALRARWEPRLNDRHLFSSIGDALEFREVADARMPEHAPFFAYGLYLVSD